MATNSVSYEVGIRLQVLITRDQEHWFAQALEIDYAAAGMSLEDAQKSFEKGLTATIHEHLRLYGNVDKMLTPPTSEVLRELVASGRNARFQFTGRSNHIIFPPQFPFGAIDYLQPEKAA